jgi:hypothetical protein
MGIHSAPEGRSIILRKGVQEKQGLDIWPVHHSTQVLVARERRHIVLEVRMTCHGSDSDQQLSPRNSVKAREQMPAPGHVPQSIGSLLRQTRFSKVSQKGDG